MATGNIFIQGDDLPSDRQRRREEAKQAAAPNAGGFELLRADALRVDHRYQRKPNGAHVNRIARHFNPAIFGTITVSKHADGTYWIIDGQHRIEALKKAGKGATRIPCVVHTGLTPRDEALMFYEMNSLTKPMTAQEKLKGAIEAGEDAALKIRATVEAAGFRLVLDDSDIAHGGIPGVGALVAISKQYRDGHLFETLRLIADTWGTATGPRHVLLRGVADFISVYRDQFDRRRFIAQLRYHDQDALAQRAQEIRRAMGISSQGAMTYVLVDIYNKRLSTGNRLQPTGVSGYGR